MENQIELDIVIIPEDEGKGKIYSISSIQIPNVVTQGKSIEEAKKRLKEALSLYLEEMPEEKIKIIRIEKENNPPMVSRMFL